jgi:hypothetical protein
LGGRVGEEEGGREGVCEEGEEPRVSEKSGVMQGLGKREGRKEGGREGGRMNVV